MLARTTSSRISAVMSSTAQSSGMPRTSAASMYKDRMSTALLMRISCTVRAGIHNARIGGTTHSRRRVATRITPDEPHRNCARSCQCGLTCASAG
ncbi:Uncharacterised protein [Bordetella pertussis]|nr:Uncharacterised protein [Bordetella pertussis]CFN80799.1 Uncharacterised protein [Bordetella pertussis]CFO07472.1 Uncharacterised protein [Bordetella pertussis]CFO36344.1 Uncharacterised protein [Bordetella pertussis]CFP60378.1 Uncharacterised protein [Bordetella pertussis]